MIQQERAKIREVIGNKGSVSSKDQEVEQIRVGVEERIIQEIFQTHLPTNVWMPDLGLELHRGRFCGIGSRDRD